MSNSSNSSSSAELAALDQQNQQLAYLQDEAQNVATARTYRQANIQSTRGWRGLVSSLYLLFGVFFVALLAFTLPAGASSTVLAVRAVVALCVIIFPWCIPALSAGAVLVGARIRDVFAAAPYRRATDVDVSAF